MATELKNRDFAAYVRVFGGHGETVTTRAEFVSAFKRALTSGKPSIIPCITDPEALTPARSLSQISETTFAMQGGRSG